MEIVAPQDIDGMQKVDFNDTLTHSNLDSVKSLIDNAIDRLTQDTPSKDINVENIINQIDTNVDLNDIANELNISSEKELVEHMINDSHLDEIYSNEIDEIMKNEDYSLEELDTNINDKDLELER